MRLKGTLINRFYIISCKLRKIMKNNNNNIKFLALN